MNPYRGTRWAFSIRWPAGAQDAGTVGLAVRRGAGLLGIAITSLTIVRLREWNPSKWVYEQALKKEAATRDAASARVGTAGDLAGNLHARVRPEGAADQAGVLRAGGICGLVPVLGAGRPDAGLGNDLREGFVFVGLALVALLLANAQSVTALTTERDGQTLELLLVTDVTPKEFVLGKLGGVLYNTAPVLAVPLLLVIVGVVRGQLSLENAVYVMIGFLVLAAFSTMLGLHSGLSYSSSRAAIAHSLGTVFFLFVGMFICLMLIVEARSSFALQFPPFLLFILGGSLGLTASLTRKNPAPALKLASFILPFADLLRPDDFLLGDTLRRDAGDRGRLRLRDRGDAGAGDQRVRPGWDGRRETGSKERSEVGRKELRRWNADVAKGFVIGH